MFDAIATFIFKVLLVRSPGVMGLLACSMGFLLLVPAAQAPLSVKGVVLIGLRGLFFLPAVVRKRTKE